MFLKNKKVFRNNFLKIRKVLKELILITNFQNLFFIKNYHIFYVKSKFG